MTIDAVNELGATDGSDESLTVNYEILTDDSEGVLSILASSDVPQLGDRYKSSQYLVTGRSVSCADKAEQWLWSLTVNHVNRNTSAGGGTTVGWPRDRIQSLDFGIQKYDAVVEEGYLEGETSKSAITNSAGDPFDPPVMDWVANRVLIVTQRETVSFKPQKAQDEMNTLNENAITVAGVDIEAGKGKMLRVKPKLQADGTYVCTYEIEIAKARPFVHRLVDLGFNYLDGSDRKAIRLSDVETDYEEGEDREDDDQLVNDPQNLDGSGGILASGSSTVFREYRTLEYSDWNTTLNLVSQAP